MKLKLASTIVAVVVIPAAVLAVSVIDLPTSPERMPVPVRVVSNLVSGHAEVPPNQSVTLTVPAGVVLTDAIASDLDGCSGRRLAVADSSGPFFGDVQGGPVSISLRSGILSDGTLTVTFTGSTCQGRIMWTGYRP